MVHTQAVSLGDCMAVSHGNTGVSPGGVAVRWYVMKLSQVFDETLTGPWAGIGVRPGGVPRDRASIRRCCEWASAWGPQPGTLPWDNPYQYQGGI